MEGVQSCILYLVTGGTVALEVVMRGRPVGVSTLHAGDVLGWSSVTEDDSKQFQARALEPVEAWAFDGARLRHACEQDYAFGFAFMRKIASVLSERLHAIRAQLVDIYSPAGPV
jgi:CRP-like cAMP-binding protein